MMCLSMSTNNSLCEAASQHGPSPRRARTEHATSTCSLITELSVPSRTDGFTPLHSVMQKVNESVKLGGGLSIQLEPRWAAGDGGSNDALSLEQVLLDS